MKSDPPTIVARPGQDAGTLMLELSGSVAPADLPGLAARVRILLARWGHEHIVCDVAGVTQPDAATVDALARLQVAAKNRGLEVSLLHASARLQELVTLCGLEDVVPCVGSVVETGRKPEEREDGLRVEEERDPGDASV